MTGVRKTNERLVLLIDAENISPRYAAAIVGKAATLGRLVTIRAYGHFGNDKLKGWREPSIDDLGIFRVSVPQSNPRKNSADFKLAIEAMDMLHTRHLDGICLASSDGDFSILAERFRASALSLYLFGQAKTPADYKALSQIAFIEVESLSASVREPAASAKPNHPPSRAAQAKTPAPKPHPVRHAAPSKAKVAAVPIPDALAEQVRAAIRKAAGPDGAASSQKIGNALNEPGRPFRVRDHGFTGMKQLLEGIRGVQVEKRGTETWARAI